MTKFDKIDIVCLPTHVIVLRNESQDVACTLKLKRRSNEGKKKASPRPLGDGFFGTTARLS